MRPSNHWLRQEEAHAFNFLTLSLPPQVLTEFKRAGAQGGHCIVQERAC